MPITKEKWDDLLAAMKALHIREEDLVEKFVLGGGSGGQKINKTSSCVYLRHVPSGIELKCQRDRSREMNRYFARRELCSRIEELVLKEKSERQMKIEKIRRQKRKRSRRAKEKMLENKKHHAEKKALRQRPRDD